MKALKGIDLAHTVALKFVSLVLPPADGPIGVADRAVAIRHVRRE